MKQERIKEFIDNCCSFLKKDQITSGEHFNESMFQATFDHSTNIIASIRPKTTEELAKCLKQATENHVRIYISSGGKNIGLGCSLPPSENSVLIELHDLNKITQFDEDLAYITVEAGVTFRQVFDFLEKKKSKLMMDSIGSVSSATIVGNVSERGHGLGMYADRFQNVCGFEVVLPNGDIINTGYSSFGENKVTPLAKGGVGPSLDGLFSQSNLGVITKVTFWLKPRTEHFQSFYFELTDDASLDKLVETWRKIQLLGLQASLRIFSDTRLIALNRQLKKEEEWSEELREKLRKEVGIKNKWIGFGGIYSASKDHAAADRKFIETKLNGIWKEKTFFDQNTAKSLVTDEDRQKYDFFYKKSLLQGHVSDKTIDMCYWRKPNKNKEENDIHANKCGVYWYCPIIPSTGEDIIRLIKIIEDASEKYRLEPNVGFLFVSERAIDVTGAILFDKEVSTEAVNAKLCHDTIMNDAITAGYPPYRLGIQSMNLMSNVNNPTSAFLKTIKHAIDPTEILASGRYILNN